MQPISPLSVEVLTSARGSSRPCVKQTWFLVWRLCHFPTILTKELARHVCFWKGPALS